jgi:hypothetical protein
MRGVIVLAALALACAGAPQSPRDAWLERSLGAGVEIYPQVLANVLVSEGADVGAGPKPALVYLSRALCKDGKASRRLRLGPELQDVLGDTARELRREARWVDSPKLFEQPEAADSGDILVCFGSIEWVEPRARVQASVVSRDGTREQSSFEFSHDGEHWVLAQ